MLLVPEAPPVNPVMLDLCQYIEYLSVAMETELRGKDKQSDVELIIKLNSEQ